MDFFRAQHDARRRTRLLVGLFLLSLFCLLAMANLILYFLMASTPQQPSFYAVISVLILLVVFLSSIFKSLSLRQGGAAVAQMLNARLLATPSNSAEQRLLNVVDEMAIASGTPVPPVYVMEESAINAFAAGHSINDAVIGITRGAIEKLNRDELQGVIAHEFSHVLHGDMRLNLRLIAWLHGIMVLGIAGHYVLRAASVSRRNNNKAGIAAIGLGLIVLGASGNFFGSLIKAAVSRQREYLADASAVQYTRNPQGIAGALKRIATDTGSPVLTNPAASQISHSLFSEGVKLRFSSLFATHPPLEKRIRVIDPQWDGKYQPQRLAESENISASLSAQQQSTPIPQAVSLAIARAGSPDALDISEAQTVHRDIPADLASSAHNPLGAAAMICLLLQSDCPQMPMLKTDRTHIEQLLRSWLPTDIDADLFAEMCVLLPRMMNIEPAHRLPLVNICLGSLRQMSSRQYQYFRKVITLITASQPALDLASWVLLQLTVQHLDRATGIVPAAPSSGLKKLNQLRGELEVFFSVLSYSGQGGDKNAAAFSAAANSIGLPELNLIVREDLRLEAFQQATNRLTGLMQAQKITLIQGVSVCVFHDQKLTVNENEFLKMTSELLDWPLPAKIFR